MEKSKALEILKCLANGIDPGTGEAYPPGSAYQHPDTVRALYSCIRLLEDPVAPAQLNSTPTKPALDHINKGKPWSQEEDRQLGLAYDNGRTVKELSQMVGRSVWAVEARLARLGKIPSPPTRFPTRTR